MRGGEKIWQAIKQGVPLRLEVGPRDIAKGEVFMGRRDKGLKEKLSLPKAEFIKSLPSILDEIQNNLLGRARALRDANLVKIDSFKQFEEFFADEETNSKRGGALPVSTGTKQL